MIQCLVAFKTVIVRRRHLRVSFKRRFPGEFIRSNDRRFLMRDPHCPIRSSFVFVLTEFSGNVGLTRNLAALIESLGAVR
jgi:hypothetical protein